MGGKHSRCAHDEDVVDLASINPAPPGWGVAVLWQPTTTRVELSVRVVAAWALIHCRRCSKSLVVPMTAAGGRLQYDFEDEPNDHVESRLVEPGLRAITEVCPTTGRRLLITVPGEWTPGYQPLDEAGE